MGVVAGGDSIRGVGLPAAGRDHILSIVSSNISVNMVDKYYNIHHYNYYYYTYNIHE